MNGVLKAVVIGCCLFLIQPIGAVCPSMDFTDDCRVDLEDFALFASQWLDEGIPNDPAQMIWVSISDPGIAGHEGFIGEMSKYEISNAQYCTFLNAALAEQQVVFHIYKVYAASDTNHNRPYYDLNGSGSAYNGATNGGAARINYTGGGFTVDAGFENHPVTYVSWYGATAFASYYGYRLPTQWEWQAVADYDGSYTYGCGTTIANSIANYFDSTHPDGTTAGGAFGVYGYGLADLAGNVWELTSTTAIAWQCIIVGGDWTSVAGACSVSSNGSINQTAVDNYGVGFRVCRMPEPDLTWIFVDEPAFDGAISKYETTNAQYCKFLNAALATDDIIVDEEEDVIKGADGSNPGQDFVNEYYYSLNAEGWTNYNATAGGSSRINYSNGLFSVDAGFQNHPVTMVSWYGATAFCNYYGLRLPSGAEWQAVADYDGTYSYGCGATITNTTANYQDSTHPYGTTTVGAFGTYGYGMADMAGNVSEFTSDVPSTPTQRPIRGGAWSSDNTGCLISYWSFTGMDNTGPHIGFRAVH